MLTKSRVQMVLQIAMLALLLISLVNYKGAAGIERIRQTRATGAVRMAEIPIGRAAASGTSLDTVAYLKIVWPRWTSAS